MITIKLYFLVVKFNNFKNVNKAKKKRKDFSLTRQSETERRLSNVS